MAKQSALNPKMVQKQKEKAITEAEKRIKAFEKIAKKAYKKAEKEEKSMEKFRKKLLEPISSLPCSLRREPNTGNNGSTFSSSSHGVPPTSTQPGIAVVNGSLSSAPKFSDIVNNGTISNKSRGFGGVSRKVLLRKQQSDSISTAFSGDFRSRVGSESGLKDLLISSEKKSIRSLTGLRRGDDVLYVRKYDLINNKINTESSNSAHHIYASIPCKETDSLSLSNGYLDSGKCSEMSNNSINSKSTTSHQLNSNNNNHINQHYHHHPHHYPPSDNSTNIDRLYARPALRDLFGSSYDDSSTNYYHQRSSNERSFSPAYQQIGGGKSLLHRTVSEPDFLSHMTDSGLGDEMISCNTSSYHHNHHHHPHHYHQHQNHHQESGSIFERPGFGSVAFRHSILSASSLLTPYTSVNNNKSIAEIDDDDELIQSVSNDGASEVNLNTTLNGNGNDGAHYHSLEALRAAQNVGLPNNNNNNEKPVNGSTGGASNNGNGSDSIGSAGSLAQRNATLSVMSGTTSAWDEDGNTLIGDSASTTSAPTNNNNNNNNNKTSNNRTIDGENGIADTNGLTTAKVTKNGTVGEPMLTPSTPPVVLFLAAQGMLEYTEIFQKEKIDLESLALLNETDLKSLGLPLGPRRKLMLAIERRKATLQEPGTIKDTIL